MGSVLFFFFFGLRNLPTPSEFKVQLNQNFPVSTGLSKYLGGPCFCMYGFAQVWMICARALNLHSTKRFVLYESNPWVICSVPYNKWQFLWQYFSGIFHLENLLDYVTVEPDPGVIPMRGEAGAGNLMIVVQLFLFLSFYFFSSFSFHNITLS